MPNRPHASDPLIARKLPLPRRRRPFSATPAYYTRFLNQPPAATGWYFCWTGPRAGYLYWPTGDWTGVDWWVELPPFVQELLPNLKELQTDENS